MAVKRTVEGDYRPPQSSEAEMSTLGAMFLSARALEDVCEYLTPRDFYVPAHQYIFAGMASLWKRSVPVDFITLSEHLKTVPPPQPNPRNPEATMLEFVGGVDYLVQVAEACPSAANAMYYADQVRDKHVRRELIVTAQKLAEEADTSEDTRATIAEIGGRLDKIESGSFKYSGVNLAEVTLDEAEIGLPFGFPSIERQISTRGFPAGQFNMIMANSGIGKTPFMTQMCYDTWVGTHIKDHEPGARNAVCYALFADLSPSQWKRRVLKLLTGYTSQPKDMLELERWDSAFTEVNDPYLDEDNPIILYDGQFEDGNEYVETFVAWLRNADRKYKFRAVFVDYLQEIETKEKTSSKSESLMAITSKLRRVAGKLNPECVMVVGSQETVRPSGEVVPRYSPEAHEKCGLCLRIKRERQAKETEIQILKNRFGSTFPAQNVEFDMQHLRYIDLEAD